MEELINRWAKSRQRMIICPVDDYLIFGPRGGLESYCEKVMEISEARPDAILTFCGSLIRFKGGLSQTRLIANLSASTVLSNHSRKVPVHSVELAEKLGASACAYHINLTSAYESEMIREGAKVVEACFKRGLKSLGIIYPRREFGGEDPDYEKLKHNELENYVELIRHCVAVGRELGFDVIKSKYTGTAETFTNVASAAPDVPIVIAGGPLLEEEEAIALAIDACSAGAAGVSFGRNVFGRNNSANFIKKLKDSLCKV
ncbi:MAG: hypothetical protein WDZ84_01490 [Rhodovibrionaceae bacterium]